MDGDDDNDDRDDDGKASSQAHDSNASNVLSDGGQDPLPEDHVEVQDDAAIRMVHPDDIRRCGPGFTITWRPPTDIDRPLGCWQAVCCYHQKTANTKCTKTLNVKSCGSKENSLSLVNVWCLQAPDFPKNNSHSNLKPKTLELLPDEVLEARAHSMPAPSAIIMADADMDVVESPNARAPRPRGRGHSRGGRGGRRNCGCAGRAWGSADKELASDSDGSFDPLEPLCDGSVSSDSECSGLG